MAFLWRYSSTISSPPALDESEELHQVPILVSPGRKSSVCIVYERGGGNCSSHNPAAEVSSLWDVNCFQHSEDCSARIWRHYDSSKCRELFVQWHSFTSQKTWVFRLDDPRSHWMWWQKEKSPPPPGMEPDSLRPRHHTNCDLFYDHIIREWRCVIVNIMLEFSYVIWNITFYKPDQVWWIFCVLKLCEPIWLCLVQ